MSIKQYLSNTADKRYKEHEALQQLLQLASAELAADSARLDANPDVYVSSQFTIDINGVKTAFMFGGPQYEALCAFIEHLADENMHEVDFKNETVVGFL